MRILRATWELTFWQTFWIRAELLREVRCQEEVDLLVFRLARRELSRQAFPGRVCQEAGGLDMGFSLLIWRMDKPGFEMISTRTQTQQTGEKQVSYPLLL